MHRGAGTGTLDVVRSEAAVPRLEFTRVTGPAPQARLSWLAPALDRTPASTTPLESTTPDRTPASTTPLESTTPDRTPASTTPLESTAPDRTPAIAPLETTAPDRASASIAARNSTVAPDSSDLPQPRDSAEIPDLTELVEIFAALGLHVTAHEVSAPSEHRFTFRRTTFDLSGATTVEIAAAFVAAATGELEVDGFLGLVGSAGLGWRDALLVRIACRYLRQAGLRTGAGTSVEILTAHADFVRAFVELFHAAFDPERAADREASVAAADSRALTLLEAATTLPEDQLLRGLYTFCAAVLRTNWFQPDREVAAFKLDPARLSVAAPVTPYREIFVHAARVEGSHVRGGAIARGGLRWSDRPDDFRTEVLGLMKTQSVKNSVIVPMGAKGAFVVRGTASELRGGARGTASGSRITARGTAADPHAVRRAYAAFIGGLLDVTDNIVDGAVVPPAHTVVRDGPDPYLVVAADKGTARFSDLANGIAVERGFWLGDAFASGGRTGYDHKGLGITARGAWRSIRRHLGELGIDPDAQAFTVAGIGDMSGDVFGNGMLETDRIMLVAAFDHRHIFLDPNPDPVLSFRERERLAGLERGSWADYDRALLSAGGGVWPRSAKSVPLSPQVRDRLGVTATEMTAPELIRAILSARVDLLFNGGIGTYVRATGESDAEVADPTNDDVRVTADRLSCRVIGEGGNLGLTQRARIEFAVAGGRVNADFIDNAAGVAISDREVNLKIALNTAVAQGDLTVAERDALLTAATEDVVAAVLADCDRQALAISLAEAHAPFLIDRHGRLIENLEQAAGIDRTAEFLPAPAELAARRRAGTGLVRPEIAVLLAMSKNLVRDELLASDALDDPIVAGTLLGYFPERMRKLVPEAVFRAHPVAREIVAVTAANQVINRVGPGMIHRLEERVGAGTAQIVLACTAVQSILDIDGWWRDALALPVAPQSRLSVLTGIQDAIEQSTAWLLARHRAHSWQREIDSCAPLVAELVAVLPRPGGRPERDAANLRLLAQALPLSGTARRAGLPVALVAQTYRELGELIGLDWLARTFATTPASDHWETLAAAVLVDELHSRWHALAAAVLHEAGPEDSARHLVTSWSVHPHATRLLDLVGELRRSGTADIARLCVVNAELAAATGHHDSD
ncbi:NAD-glutamate dehydrogenase [Nocardia sp. 2]|uniref:NAD-glutamate dehydrogenase n=1 Tax=Nocardia acididurans TaxID=2802282 RepID=A0ABS1M3B5_9NOCA|nr:NAD-glutamate dehydrogenase domain-containing protein [Nocardia acididurans]MBL1075152.1 NAD-glutamate dehydrogenase [Nocardia acididurans]